MRYLYSALFYLLLPVILLRMLLRSRQAPAYRRRLAERFGIFPAPLAAPEQPVIWVHAVSVGETLAAAPLIESLLRDYPRHRIAVTTTTPTGSDRVSALFGDRVFHVYSPWDMPGAVKRFLERVRPGLLIIMETELWPNLLHYCHSRGCPVVLANARLSERSARGYARFGGLTRGMLQQLSVVACQSRSDGDRFLSLGLAPERLTVTGSIKFDLELDDELRARAATLREEIGRPVILASSTHPGEDEIILSAFRALRQQIPKALCLLVPRHPERFDSVYELCVADGWQVQRRSIGAAISPDADILLGDTMGELRLLSGVASVAVIGGSFIEHGGQNVLEAAAWGVPVVAGPHMFNFTEISALLLEAGAMEQLQEPAQLIDCLLRILQDDQLRQRMGSAGEQVVAENRGALARLQELVRSEVTGA
jgi:3-deoxy-D-manno-octulosonic-acid transferase